MSKRLSQPEIAVDIEPHQNGCRLSLVMSWDALETLLSKVALQIDPRKAALQREEAERDQTKSRLEAQRAVNLEIGRKILFQVEALKENGVLASAAWTRDAAEQDMTVSLARSYSRIARTSYMKSRDREIERLARKGVSIRDIGVCVGLAKSTVSDRLKSLGIAPGAGGGSRVSSGDRERSERRETLDATEAPKCLPRGAGKETRSEATTSSPEPLPIGEMRGRGGKAPTCIRDTGGSGDE